MWMSRHKYAETLESETQRAFERGYQLGVMDGRRRKDNSAYWFAAFKRIGRAAYGPPTRIGVLKLPR